MTIEVMKQALEALETCMYPQQKQIQAITSLRQAIEQAEKQEPHSWYSAEHDEWMTNKTRKEHEALNSYTHKVGGFDLPLYTTPQPQREWVGLTDGLKVILIKNAPNWTVIQLIEETEQLLKDQNS